MRKNGLLGLVLLALVVSAGALAGCGEEPVPLNPSYTVDIKPLMAARCIRCHGAGGKLNVDPDSVLNKQVKDPSIPPQAPKLADFTRLEDMGDRKGLLFYTLDGGVGMQIYIKTGPMPPPPAPALTEREYTMLMRWLKNPILQ
jgi:hypothetical protein